MINQIFNTFEKVHSIIASHLISICNLQKELEKQNKRIEALEKELRELKK